jgi:uncharacterized protein (TIGR02647 family)
LKQTIDGKNMKFNDALVQELNLLMKFPDTSMEGLKVHHTAEKALIDAAQRLYDKGLITQHDGGYLTDLGREASETVTLLTGLMTPQ